jgi:hypothetical protein
MNAANVNPNVLAECRLLRSLGLELRRRAFQSLSRRSMASMGLPKKVSVGRPTKHPVAKADAPLKRIDMAV